MGTAKSGRSSLIGNAGECYVVAELLKRGIIATFAPRNAPAFDILATRDNRTVKIRVKTKTELYKAWHWSVKKDGSIFLELSRSGDYTVLVSLTEDRGRMEYFVIPTEKIDGWLKRDFEEWVRLPNHDPANKIRQIDRQQSDKRLEPYLEAWEILWKGER